MYVVIMAGGKGMRISAVASDVPKQMLGVCGKPVLEHQINNFVHYGYRDFIFVTRHLWRVIKAYFRDGRHLEVNISYFEEETPLRTAGAFLFLSEE